VAATFTVGFAAAYFSQDSLTTAADGCVNLHFTVIFVYVSTKQVL